MNQSRDESGELREIGNSSQNISTLDSLLSTLD